MLIFISSHLHEFLRELPLLFDYRPRRAVKKNVCDGKIRRKLSHVHNSFSFNLFGKMLATFDSSPRDLHKRIQIARFSPWVAQKMTAAGSCD